MRVTQEVYARLLDNLRAIDPLIVEAVDDVDETLLEEFKKLSFDERIARASETRQTLDSFHEQ